MKETVKPFVTLKVTEALTKDVGRALARMGPEDLERLEAVVGDTVEVEGKRKALCKVMPAYEKEQLVTLTPGKRYFLEQRIKDAVNKEVASCLKGLGNSIVTSLQDLSAAFHERRLLMKDVTGREEEMFFHGAFLVPNGSLEDIQRLLTKWNSAHQESGLLLELSGPWPPYHFAPVLE